MDPLVIILIVLILGNIGFMAAVFMRTRQNSTAPQDSGSLMLLQNQLAEMTRAMDMRLGEGTRNMSEMADKQASQAQQLMSTISRQMQDQMLEVVKGVTETKESTKQVFVIA